MRRVSGNCYRSLTAVAGLKTLTKTVLVVLKRARVEQGSRGARAFSHNILDPPVESPNAPP
ncbi:MAG: hypothetical protein J7J76_09070 [Candidatus Latescibacteria bacterium]|nr:hypothetical protein [Candidatus Latescibacterota bacterium]